MWKRPSIKETTLKEYKDYAKDNGLKLWKVFEHAIKALKET